MTFLLVEEDGDEIFVAYEHVRCCIIGFENGTSVYSKLEPTRLSNGLLSMSCPVCKGSYGLIEE